MIAYENDAPVQTADFAYPDEDDAEPVTTRDRWSDGPLHEKCLRRFAAVRDPEAALPILEMRLTVLGAAREDAGGEVPAGARTGASHDADGRELRHRDGGVRFDLPAPRSTGVDRPPHGPGQRPQAGDGGHVPAGRAAHRGEISRLVGRRCRCALASTGWWSAPAERERLTWRGSWPRNWGRHIWNSASPTGSRWAQTTAVRGPHGSTSPASAMPTIAGSSAWTNWTNPAATHRG